MAPYLILKQTQDTDNFHFTYLLPYYKFKFIYLGEPIHYLYIPIEKLPPSSVLKIPADDGSLP